ncbi:MAG: fibronectin type III-like domain-contianing protein [Mobilitalea sp.]
MDVLYPFGFGLSYTTFDYRDLELTVLNGKDSHKPANKLHIKDTEQLQVSLKVKNTGMVSGKDIVQLYIQDKEASVSRPLKELKGFVKVSLAPGEEKTVTFTLDKRSFAYYSTELGDWYAESGTFDVLIGKSSREIVLSAAIEMESSVKLPFAHDDRTTYADVINQMEDPTELMNMILGSFGNTSAGEDTAAGDTTGESRMLIEMIKGLPLHSIRSFAAFGLNLDEIEALLKKVLDK